MSNLRYSASVLRNERERCVGAEPAARETVHVNSA